MKKTDVFDKIKPIYISLGYILAVIVVTYLTSIIIPFIDSDTIAVNSIRLFTNAFNAYFEKDYLSNIGLVFVILGSAEIYLKAAKRYFVYRTAIVSGIIASYIFSISWIIDSYTPAAGTSIIASTMLLISFIYIGIETIRLYAKLLREIRNKLIYNFIFVLVGVIFECLILLFYYGAYIASNPSWYLHIGGAIVFFVFYALLIKPKWQKYFR